MTGNLEGPEQCFLVVDQEILFESDIWTVFCLLLQLFFVFNMLCKINEQCVHFFRKRFYLIFVINCLYQYQTFFQFCLKIVDLLLAVFLVVSVVE